MDPFPKLGTLPGASLLKSLPLKTIYKQGPSQSKNRITTLGHCQNSLFKRICQTLKMVQPQKRRFQTSSISRSEKIICSNSISWFVYPEIRPEIANSPSCGSEPSRAHLGVETPRAASSRCLAGKQHREIPKLATHQLPNANMGNFSFWLLKGRCKATIPCCPVISGI